MINSLNRDPSVLATVGDISEPDVNSQEGLMTTPDVIIKSATVKAMSRPKTKIFNNLCEDSQLEEWNEMQADMKKVIREVKALTVPANSAKIVDPIRVTYIEIDEKKFDLAILYYAVTAGFDVVTFASAFMTDEVIKAIFFIVDSDKAELNVELNAGLRKIFKKFTPAFILSQNEVFEEKIQGLLKDIEKESMKGKKQPKNKTVKTSKRKPSNKDV